MLLCSESLRILLVSMIPTFYIVILHWWWMDGQEGSKLLNLVTFKHSNLYDFANICLLCDGTNSTHSMAESMFSTIDILVESTNCKLETMTTTPIGVGYKLFQKCGMYKLPKRRT